MITRKLRFGGGVFAAVVTAGALAGCSAANGTAQARISRIEQNSIVVDSVPVAEEGGLYVAQAQGFFARQGLTVKIVPVTGAERAIPDLQTGRAQLVAGNYVSFILAQLAGKFDNKPASLRIVAAGSEIEPGTEDLYVMPGSKYQSVSELAKAHARVGLNTANDIGGLLLGASLTEVGYQLGDIRQVIPAGGFPALLRMLPAGHVDAAWLPQPLGEEAEQQIGAVPITDFDQGSLENFPFTGYIGSTSWVQAHPDTVAAFLRALNEGQQLADTDRKAVETAMETYLSISPMIAANMAIDSYPLEVDVPQLQRVADSMFEFGLTPGVKSPYKISAMVQPEPGMISG